MDRNLTLYQVAPQLAEKVFNSIDEFNRGRTATNGYYAISMATAYRPYYGFCPMYRLLCLSARLP